MIVYGKLCDNALTATGALNAARSTAVQFLAPNLRRHGGRNVAA